MKFQGAFFPNFAIIYCIPSISIPPLILNFTKPFASKPRVKKINSLVEILKDFKSPRLAKNIKIISIPV